MSQKESTFKKYRSFIFGISIGIAIGIALCLYGQGYLIPYTAARGIYLNLSALLVNLIFLIKTRNPGHLIMMVLCMIQLIH
jgi:hypothetical protein